MFGRLNSKIWTVDWFLLDKEIPERVDQESNKTERRKKSKKICRNVWRYRKFVYLCTVVNLELFKFTQQQKKSETVLKY